MSMNFHMRLLLLMLCFATASAQTPDSNALLAPLQSSIEQTRAARAELLAPRSYARATATFKELEKDVSGKVRADRLQRKQAEVQQAVATTQKLVEQSSKTLSTVIQAYDDAVTAGAPASTGEVWSKAEQRFRQAVAEVEGNDLDDARGKGAEAEVLLREVELLAIKNSVLDVARKAIASAQAARVPEFAPRSFAVAQQQLGLAEQQLTSSRYELAEPTKLAAQATYEARHAQYLAGLIEQAQSKDGQKQQLAEQQLLAIEQPIRQLVMEMEIPAIFDQGYNAVLDEARSKIQQQQQALIAARQANRDREQDIADLKQEATQLKTRLGGESEERQTLLKRLSTQERLRENIGKVESMFSADEGRVYRQGNQIVMSLNAISFRSGKSTIEPASFPVLVKVDRKSVV